MSAHTHLATIAAAQAAMADLLARVGCPDTPTNLRFFEVDGTAQVRAYVPIADEPVNGADQVLAGLVAEAQPGKKTRVAAYSEHRMTQGEYNACWCDNFRFTTPGGAAWMAPRTLAKLVLEAMKPS